MQVAVSITILLSGLVKRRCHPVHDGQWHLFEQWLQAGTRD